MLNPEDHKEFLNGKHVAIGITGGIAAYKTPLLIRLLRRAGAEVRVIATESALKFTTRWTLETLSENPLETEMFPEDSQSETHHISTAAWADLFLIVPATANVIGKIASGISDDVLTTTLCAYTGPVALAPAMNTNMYENPITKKNIGVLRAVGYRIIDPDSGEMACHTYGVGRMAEPERVFEEALEILRAPETNRKDSIARTTEAGPLAGKKVLITAGPCREPIDTVRFISNRSSGKMGYALAEQALALGAEVTLISGPTALNELAGVKTIRIETTQELLEKVLENIPASNILIMAAAPADFTALEYNEQKLKKGDSPKSLNLKPTPDILKEVSKVDHSAFVIGFALESENLIDNARGKLHDKKLDMIVANPAAESDAGPDSPTNRAVLIEKSGETTEIPRMEKTRLAQIILEKTIALCGLGAQTT